LLIHLDEDFHIQGSVFYIDDAVIPLLNTLYPRKHEIVVRKQTQSPSKETIKAGRNILFFSKIQTKSTSDFALNSDVHYILPVKASKYL
jgi:hypothetical protein